MLISSILVVLISSISQHINFGWTIKPSKLNIYFLKYLINYLLINTLMLYIFVARCYEQFCAKSGNGWSCMFSKNHIRNCSSNSVCLEGSKNGTEVYRYCQSKFAMNESLVEQIDEKGKYCDDLVDKSGTICYCKTNLCNNQFETPKSFKVGEEEYHEAAEEGGTYIKS